jgi:16S rRNA (uracil1498-N3)-methyltransferase
MRRFFVDSSHWSGSSLHLPQEEAHHLRDVLRVREGDEIAVFDGRGREARARVHFDRPAGAGVSLEVMGTSQQARPPLTLTLFQAVPKSGKMDWVVEKVTELGVTAIVPVLSERVVLRLDADQQADRCGRWERIAKAASKQSGNNWTPVIEPFMPFAAVLDRVRTFDGFLVGSLSPDARPMKSVLSDLRARACGRLGLLIGPEGDFTPEEMRLVRNAGACEVSFGPQVLRAETAPLFAVSVLLYEFVL